MMNGRGISRLRELESLYDHPSSDDISFVTLLEEQGTVADDELAELIEEDGRQRVMRNREVSLERYIDAVPALFERPVPLDAAIDVTLRWMSRADRDNQQSVEALVAQYPQLAVPIYEAAVLNNALCSTSGIRSKVQHITERPVPADFGPKLANGQQRYELRSLLGSGAFGQVYQAKDRYLSEEGYEALVAIKILAKEGRTRWSRQRLVEEATKARRVEHPNVVRVLDRGVSADDEDFIVYELIDGGDLSAWIRRHRGSISPREAARLMAKVCRGVQAVHAAGLVHCDLKPNNITLTTDGEPKVADFGIAIRSGESMAELRDQETDARPIGNLAFISPEQYRMEDHALTIPSDVYALGGMLYLLLTKELPNGSSVEEIARVHHPTKGRTAPPSPQDSRPEIDRDLNFICQRALATDPTERYSSAGAMADDLEAWLRHEPLLWTKPSALRITRLWTKRRPTVAAISVILLMAILGGGLTANILHGRAVEARAQAEFEAARRAEEEALREAFRQRIHQIGVQIFGGEIVPKSSPQVLLMYWVIQFMMGADEPRFDHADLELRQMRYSYVAEIVERAQSNQRYNNLETLLWRTALAFWLLERGDLEEAEDKLDHLHQEWIGILDPNDRWIGYIDALLAIKTVKIAANEQHNARRHSVQQADLAHAQTVLAEQEAMIGEDHPASPLHQLVLDAQLLLYGPDLLDQPEHVAVVKERIEWCRRFRFDRRRN